MSIATVAPGPTFKRPGPTISPESSPYWEAAARGALVVQHCVPCGRVIWFPRSRCPHCWSANTTWLAAARTATLEGWTQVHRPINESYKAEVPYLLAIVRLREGFLMLTRLVGAEFEALRVGQELVVDFDDLGTGTALVVFRPAGTQPGGGAGA